MKSIRRIIRVVQNELDGVRARLIRHSMNALAEVALGFDVEDNLAIYMAMKTPETQNKIIGMARRAHLFPFTPRKFRENMDLELEMEQFLNDEIQRAREDIYFQNTIGQVDEVINSSLVPNRPRIKEPIRA